MTFAILSLIVAIGSMFISGYYSLIWFIQKGMPVWVSIILAIIYVVFANMIFEYGIEFLKISRLWGIKVRSLNKGIQAHKTALRNKRQNLIYGLSILFTWSLLAGYSMFCTIGGQYDQLIQEEENTQFSEEVYIDNSSQIKNKELELVQLNQQINQKIESLNSIATIEDSWKYSGVIDRTNREIEELKTQRTIISGELNTLKEEQQVDIYEQSAGVTKRSFYNYVSDITSNDWEPLMIQFYSSLLPSIIIDLISPVALTIFMFWYKKRKKD